MLVRNSMEPFPEPHMGTGAAAWQQSLYKFPEMGGMFSLKQNTDDKPGVETVPIRYALYTTECRFIKGCDHTNFKARN